MPTCIKCGQTGNFRLFCSRCYLKDNPIIDSFSKIEITICPSCNKLSIKNKWQDYKTINSAILTIIKHKVKINKSYKDINYEINPLLPPFQEKSGVRAEGEVELRIEARHDGYSQPMKETYVLPMTLEFKPCPRCSKQNTQYFEGILQLRNPKKDVEEFLETTIAKQKFGFVTKKAKVRGGYDYYLTSNKLATRLAIQLQKRFGAQINQGAKLQTWDKQTSKDVYRISVTAKLPDFRKGDIVKYKNKPMLITNTHQKIQGKDLSTDKKTVIDPKEKIEILEKFKTSITKVEPQLEALHPETYESIKIENPKQLKQGQKVKVIIVKNKLFLID